MYLATGKQLHDLIWRKLSINDKVVHRVNGLTTKDNLPEMTKEYPIFEGSPGIPITEKDDDNQN